MPNPLNMSNEEIAEEITHLRETIDGSSRRMLELSRSLHDRMRRDDRRRIATNGNPDERTNIYLTCANLWTRFGGMIQQGLQRSRQADRLLRLLPDEEAPRRAAEPEAAAATPAPDAQNVPASSPLDDFITLYGEEMMRDASPDGQQR